MTIKCFEPNGAFSEFKKEDSEQVCPVERITDFRPFQREGVERSVPERFEKIVCKYPDRIAVKTSRELVTYSQLNIMANRLAHTIVACRGTQAEAIAILLDPGAHLMAAMLAVLKAGKFFVWVDRSSPKGRLANVLEDSQARLIIAERQDGEVGRDFKIADANLLDFASITSCVAEDNLSLNISPNSLAAINYTSGSTGEPKGVLWEQRNLLHQVMLFTNAYKVSEYDRVLLTSSGTGNAVVIGFLALLNGAALLPFDLQTLGVNRLIKWILDETVSICWIGSPLFRNICHALASDEKFPAVRILRLASEATYKGDVELYKQHFSPDCLLINGLSTTESGLICLYTVNSKTEIAGQEVPVGYPVEDKELLLLDDLGKEVGLGEVGEIAVRSSFLSPGYWQRPELTANKFKLDPKGADQRMYLSGDLGLMLTDGCVIHKGRKDFRAKVRGYTVEPAEIEKALTGHVGVGQAVVVARQEESGETRLIAYYTCAGLFSPTVSELRSFLREQLPEFMVPSTFVRIDAMRLTHSGKVDRRAFPDPDNVRPGLATAYVASRNDIERRLVAIWENVLDVRPVGINDEFFDLGGDSLSATRVISEVLKQFEVEIPLQSLFRSPTIADMAALAAEAQGKLSRNAKQDRVTGVPSVPVSRECLLSLSYSQQRLWFLDQLEPGGFSYNLFSAYRLKGELNTAILELCFNEIISRHEVLRTVFKSPGGSPQQVILPTRAITIPVFDLRGIVSEADRWTEVRRMCKEEAQRPFDLATGPLLRIMVLRLSDDEYVLLRAMHHIASDGWSEGVLFRELSELYEALSNGKSSPLPDLPVQYSEYAFWQRHWLQGERLESQLSYWKKQLHNIPTLQLPTDRPRPAIQSSRGARQYFVLSERLSQALRALSLRHGATLFMTLAAAFQTLLHRYTGQTDVAIGSPVAGRSRKKFEELIGFFVNTLVLRLDLSGQPTFVEVMGRVREVCLGALSHQELPFEKIVEELHPDRHLDANPLFQVTFAFQNTPRFLPRLSNITADEMEIDTGITRFDLHLFMEEQGNKLRGYFDYSSDLFNADTIDRLVRHFQTLLEGIVSDPASRISDLPMLTVVERQQLLLDWSNIERGHPKAKCAHEVFEEQAAKTPDALAVVYGSQQLTYGELNIRANKLAHCLRRLGVGPEVVVGLCVERSLEMIIGLLGILKAGGAYLPLDPAYPKERLGFMVSDTQARLVLTQRHYRNPSPPGLDGWCKIICLDSEWEAIAEESEANPINMASPDSLVYVMYTSGSTGTPKGVGISHRGVTRLVKGQEYAKFGEQEVFLQFAPLSFDASTFEIWGCLLNGGKLVMAPAEAHSADDLAEVLKSSPITTLWLTSALFHVMVDHHLESLRGVKQLLAGGDVLSVSHVKRVLAELPRCRLINGYGPTENTTFSCCHPVALAEQLGESVPIGRPIRKTQVYVLDDCLNLVPQGIAGELYVGGEGLARGYFNQPELTAEKFMPHPFSEKPGSRLYRTGDRVRYLSDGSIEFLGRIDDQVKIRGYRIELGEIEANLRQHFAVRETLVMAREDEPGEKRLVAYIVPKQEPHPSTTALRSYLNEKLPDYMVPLNFLFLNALPLTPNGKVDRRALPAPDQTRPELEECFVPPRTLIEKTLAAIWAEVLKLQTLGIHDNFFDLGGHSLLATQIVARIRNEFRIEMPLRALFEKPTIEGLANAMELNFNGAQSLETLQPRVEQSRFPHPDQVADRQQGEI